MNKKNTKEVTVKVTQPKGKVNKSAPMPKRVPYKKLNQELESKLLKVQGELKAENNKNSLMFKEFKNTTVPKGELQGESVFQAVGRWFNYQDLLGKVVFATATGLVAVTSGLGIYNLFM